MGVKRIGSWPGWAERAVAVDQLEELGGDFEGEGAVETDVLVVGGRDVGQHLVVEMATTSGSSATAMPRYSAVQATTALVTHGQAQGLLGLVLVVAVTDLALVGVAEVPAQGVETLALVELTGDPPAVGLVGELPGG